jgi:hypothetical protein
MDAGPSSEYWPRVDNMRHAGGFLSISKSTTDDMSPPPLPLPARPHLPTCIFVTGVSQRALSKPY